MQSSDTGHSVVFAGVRSLAKTATTTTFRKQFADSLKVAKDPDKNRLSICKFPPAFKYAIRYRGTGCGND